MLAIASDSKFWNAIYEETQLTDLSWYQEDQSLELEFIEDAQPGEEDLILLVGAGRSQLAEALLQRGYKGIVATDISDVALAKLQQELVHENRHEVRTVRDDLAAPTVLTELEPLHFWCDRATLHFMTDPKAQDTYFKLMNDLVIPGGHALIAVFTSGAPDTCSGLPVRHWTTEELSDRLGPDFVLKEARRHEHKTPKGGTQPYVYAYFQKQKKSPLEL